MTANARDQVISDFLLLDIGSTQVPLMLQQFYINKDAKLIFLLIKTFEDIIIPVQLPLSKTYRAE